MKPIEERILKLEALADQYKLDFRYLSHQIDRLENHTLDLKNEIELLRTGLNKDERQELSDGINAMLKEKE